MQLEQDGEAGLGLRDLARAVGVSPAAPYRHFASRTALLEALAVTGYRRFTEAMEAVAASNPEDPAAALGLAYVRFALEQPNLFRLMFSPQLRRDRLPGLSMAADAAFGTLRHVVGGDVAEHRTKALSAWARVHGLAVLLLDGQLRIRPGENADALVAAVLAEG